MAVFVESEKPPKVDLTGKDFVHLRALSYAGYYWYPEHGVKAHAWLCLCVCGGTKIVRGSSLRDQAPSCGCLKSELCRQAPRTHGKTGTPEWRAWQLMKGRCSNPRLKSYADYGGRGIRVCERWLRSFEAFLQDMGQRPGPGYSVERNDTNGDYTPENCRWATRLEQNRNKRNTVFLTYGGRTLPFSAWAEEVGICYKTLRYRRDCGWSTEKILTTPVKGTTDALQRPGNHAELLRMGHGE